MFTQAENLRYARHFSVEKIGRAGQETLKQSSILCIGAGGIGSPALLYLAACGVGKLAFIDDDSVELSNLQRQVLFSERDEGRAKVECARDKLFALNTACELVPINDRLSLANIDVLLDGYDLVIDGSDNYETRYLVADACAQKKIPLISASIYQFSGQLIALSHQSSPCYRCLYPNPPPEGVIPNCAQAGVLGTVPGVLGTLAATEAIKHLLNLPEKLNNSFVQLDLLNMQMKRHPIITRKDCPTCQLHKPLKDLSEAPKKANAIPVLTCEALKSWFDSGKAFTLIDVREAWERDICQIDGDKAVPLADIREMDVSEFKSPLVIYCRSGGRSAQAVYWLKNRGLKDVYNLQGGIIAWIKDFEPHKSSY
ncbi:MAG: molybdenum cofactor biosynthesis protein MoeB [Gammaproteobacteria bacterium CG11_big_fil_rev_8_21_14_0_20_46_22]|nr:MAG: molybdenum cofactor biosynthesis protein MoeB [Gammaproteobacteria bacterium CG12_big_fil_rev_8_21_14_0_65_46_12]PIR10944.1 MAG: molybdenum cofactor biosynthesis protein MoeB [Gammaproteobacteria bacterium CG11_big_fil_rev_8_21_14_0_20_46_22]